VFESIPVDCAPETRSFFNAVGELPFDSLPEDILSNCLQIESKLGRPNVHESNSPRTIDLDLLYAGNKIHMGANLTIPHPKLKIRLFVVAPLALIRPHLRLPGEQLTIHDHLKKLSAKQSPLRMVTRHW
jgi:2-amino-4-hydroxy-6-hydroxymethyldihydropteridine diphosphokinase